jgi:signal transduction histidine kinase
MGTETSGYESSARRTASSAVSEGDQGYRRLLDRLPVGAEERGRGVGPVDALVDIRAQKATENAILKRNEWLEGQVAERTASLRLIQDIATEANKARTVHQAIASALKRVCQHKGCRLGHAFARARDRRSEFVCTGLWQVGDTWRPDSEALGEFRRASALMRVAAGEGMIGRVVATHATVWSGNSLRFDDPRHPIAEKLGLRAAFAFPVPVCGEVEAVLEFFSGEPASDDVGLREIVPILGFELGHVIERHRLESYIADATTEQQSELGRELHDSVSQVLTGVSMMAETLRQELRGETSPHADLAAKLVRYLNEAQQRVRQVSRGLLPLEPDARGLMKALERLARQFRDMYDVPCCFQCDKPVLVTEYETQLYYIAREAAHNAAKHASARVIVIRLEEDARALRLIIEDDGRGMCASARTTAGMGLSIMRHRAHAIGADLDVVSDEYHGTTVTCTLPPKV